jgi:glutathione S-transferase
MLKLLYSPASPYARKVRAVAAEKSVALEVTTISLSPVTPSADVAARNPLGKVPTLVLEDGSALFDSRVICAWLDQQGFAPSLVPDGPARWPVLVNEALADGILDAALLHRYENNLRPEAMRWKEWTDGQWSKITAGVAALEARAASFDDRVDLGQIAAGCTLGYLDFRFGHWTWRDQHPRLAKWWAAFAQRPSMQETRPG